MPTATAVDAWATAIREARKEAELTQAQLADLAGTDQPTVSDAERGKVGAGMYLRLAGALGITLVFEPESNS